jgi:nicotinate (nicotinamide) nucleotide adenylyltransferase
VGLTACEALGLDTLLVVPNREPVHKGMPYDPGPEARLAMCAAMCASHQGWRAVDWEVRRPTPSYMAETLRQASVFYPGARLHLVIGTDSFLSLPSWSHPQDICRAAEVVVVERFPLTEGDKAVVGSALSSLRARFLPGAIEDASSTEVRRLLAAGQDADEHLCPGVAALIAKEGWYRTA